MRGILKDECYKEQLFEEQKLEITETTITASMGGVCDLVIGLRDPTTKKFVWIPPKAKLRIINSERNEELGGRIIESALNRGDTNRELPGFSNKIDGCLRFLDTKTHKDITYKIRTSTLVEIIELPKLPIETPSLLKWLLNHLITAS